MQLPGSQGQPANHMYGFGYLPKHRHGWDGRIWLLHVSTRPTRPPAVHTYCGPPERITAPSPTKLQAWSRTLVLVHLFCDLSCTGRSKWQWHTRLVKSKK